MRLLSFFVCFFTMAISAIAQYNGGIADGTDAKISIQLSLDGVPGGIRGLYAGGSGDGEFHISGFGALGNQQVLTIYQGGDGDGFHQLSASASLSGFTLTNLYGGGDGDGFTSLSHSMSLAGFDLSEIYAGGDGDGFSQNVFVSALNGQSIVGLFDGGDGDGYDFAVASMPLGLAMGMLFKGGTGDGFDQNLASLSLGGFSLEAIYEGGNGDGGDYTSYEGIIPLPLTLLSFSATPEEKYVLLQWVTENEVATDYFVIEKTKAGREFNWVGEETAAGFSLPEEQIHYALKDWTPYEGSSFYRLKTVDFDGQISLSHLIEVQYKSADDWNFQLFPNPNTGQHFNINTSGLPDGTSMQLVVFDAIGQQIFNKTISTSQYQSERVDLFNQLPAGSYLIQLKHPDFGQQAKILLVGGRD